MVDLDAVTNVSSSSAAGRPGPLSVKGPDESIGQKRGFRQLVFHVIHVHHMSFCLFCRDRSHDTTQASRSPTSRPRASGPTSPEPSRRAKLRRRALLVSLLLSPFEDITPEVYDGCTKPREPLRRFGLLWLWSKATLRSLLRRSWCQVLA